MEDLYLVEGSRIMKTDVFRSIAKIGCTDVSFVFFFYSYINIFAIDILIKVLSTETAEIKLKERGTIKKLMGYTWVNLDRGCLVYVFLAFSSK